MHSALSQLGRRLQVRAERAIAAALASTAVFTVASGLPSILAAFVAITASRTFWMLLLVAVSQVHR